MRSAAAFPADIKSLTALRFLAALAVVLFHFADRTAADSPLRNAFLAHGYLGVDLFFVLSGFILAHVYLRQVEQGSFSYRDFLVNRLARLYPLHLVTLAVAALLGLYAAQRGVPIDSYGTQLGLDPATGRGGAWNLALQLGLLHAWGLTDRLTFNSVSWSISAEWFAYLCFPAVAALGLALARRPRLLAAGAVALLLGLEAAVQAAWGKSLTELTWQVGILRIAPEFLLGCAMYVLGRAEQPRAWAALMALALVVAALPAVVWLRLPEVLCPLLFGLLILLLAELERQGWLRPGRLLAPFVYLGEVSYSTYMVHLLAGKVFFNALAAALHFDPQAIPGWAVWAGLAFVLALSMASYHAVELPARRFLRSALRLRPPAGALASAAAGG